MRKITSIRIRLFKSLFSYIKPDARYYAALGGLKVFALLLSLILPIFYLLLINGVMVGGKLTLLPLIACGYIGVYLLQTLRITLEKLAYNKLFLKYNLRVKSSMLMILAKLDAKKYSEYSTGDLKNRIDSDIVVTEKFFTAHILDFLYAFISAIVIAIILFAISPVLALTSFVMVPVSFWFTGFMGKKVKKLNEERRALTGRYESFLYNTFQNWKEIKSNNLEISQNEIFQNYRTKLSKLFVKNQIFWYTNRTFIAFKDFFITKMNLYFIGGLLIIAGQIDVGLLLVFMNYYSDFFDDISKITDSLLGLKNDIPSIDRVLEILNTQITDKPALNNLSDEITVKELSYKYNENQDMVLNNINLNFMPKEHVAIAGRSGCGKSTLAKMLTGLYEPCRGRVYFGQTDISAIAVESVGRKIGIVTQEAVLFNLTVKENLIFARKRATAYELEDACKKANILELINSLPDRFDTVIGERGIKLSGGQKQRLAIARTILHNPDIIIFDEATSSLDSENERAVVAAMKELSANKTLITISHRLSTILECSRVIIIDNGQIAAIGSHKELRGNNEIYDLLFNNQYGMETISDEI